MRLIWDGTVINYDQGTHIRDAIQRAGIDADKLLEDVDKNPAKYDALLERNEEVQKDNTAGHTGVPLFVYAHELPSSTSQMNTPAPRERGCK